MLNDWRILRTFNRGIWLFLLAWALMAFSYFGIQGVLLNLYLLRLGFGPEFIGLLIASGQIIWAVMALPAGAIGARMGLRAALITGSVLLTLGMGMLLMVEAFPRSVWAIWLFGCWMLLWVGAALNTVNSIPYLMNVSAAAERNHAFSAQGAVIGLMAFVGSLVAGLLPGLVIAWRGGSLDEPAPYRYALWLAPLVYALGVLVWAGAPHVKLAGEAETLSPSTKPLRLFVFFGLVVFLLTASEGAVRAFFNVYLDQALHVPTAQIGTILGVGQLLPVFIVLITPQLLGRWGTSLTLFVTTAGAGLAMLPLATLAHWVPASLGFLGVMSMLAVNGPARNIFSQEIVLPRWRTTTSAIGTIGLALGWASMAAVGGYLIVHVGFGGLFFVGAVLAFASAILWATFARRA